MVRGHVFLKRLLYLCLEPLFCQKLIFQNVCEKCSPLTLPGLQSGLPLLQDVYARAHRESASDFINGYVDDDYLTA